MNEIEKAKYYLKEIGIYTIRIKSIETEIALIRCSMGDVKSTNYESIGGSKSNFNTKSPQEIQIERLLKYEKELDELKREYYDVRIERINTILSLDDKDEIRVLYERYVLLRSWENIIDDIGYSRSATLNFHKSGLIKISKKLKVWTKLD